MKSLALILAAGKGTRMKSDLPKCLHQVAGAPMVLHVIERALSSGADGIGVVVGHGGEAVGNAAKDYHDDTLIIEQKEQLGTGHAVLQALDLIQQTEGVVTILYGDSPLIGDETITALNARAMESNAPAVLGFQTPNPGRYGRLITKGDALLAIREAKDATPEELQIEICNSGFMACPAKWLAEMLPQIQNNNAAGEFYLTDLIEISVNAGHGASFILCDEAETQGVNTPDDLRAVNLAYQNQRRNDALTRGVKMFAPETVHFHFYSQIGNDVIIDPNVVFAADVTVENGAHIRSFSHLEGAHIGENAQIGPFARIRPGSEIGEAARIGNFVETKNAQIHNSAKVNHLSYIGDAEIGHAANIGAGTITCNYDGVFKHKTKIGERAFIGSNSSLVAPITIGDDAMTASGSVITQDIPAGDMAIARAKQENKKGLARKFMDKLRAQKKSRQ